MNRLQYFSRIVLLFSLCLLFHAFAHAAHGFALWGHLKYSEGFKNFDYVNPNAPKGGHLRLVSNFRLSTFDKYNPFTLKGSAPAYLDVLLFDSLLIPSLDETGSGYGLLASDTSVAPDFKSVTFTLNEKARFHDNSPVLALDVKHTIDTLLSQYTSPAYHTLLEDIASVEILSERRVKFNFKKSNRELVLTIGSLPIFSHRWGQNKPFDQVIMDIPIGSGPYRVGNVRFGKDITYVRDPKYWANDLNVNVGHYNFDRITVKIYSDETVKLEAFKVGEFDAMQSFSARDWARRFSGKAFDDGTLKKQAFSHQNPSGFQSYVLNTRRPNLRDVRVRQALGLAIDFEWMNRQLFYGAYKRVHGLFGNTQCQAQGWPSEAELALLNPWRAHVEPATFGPVQWPARTDGEHSLRDNLKQALVLLKQAGWEIKRQNDGGGALKLRDKSGKAFELEYLDSSEGGKKTVTPWQKNLEKLGITLHYRAVDFSLYQARLQKFDFDIITINFAGTHNPGSEYADLLGSKAADTPDSGNLAGVKNPAIDALVSKMITAPHQEALLPACRALERIVVHAHYFLPQHYSGEHRLAYNQRQLAYPTPTPAYSQGLTWLMRTWWAK